MYQKTLTFHSKGRGTYDITNDVAAIVVEASANIGLCHLFIKHTSASLMICENGDPQVRADLETFMQHYIKDGDPMFLHTAEGDDDMSAHVRTLLTETSLMIPITDGRLALGTWQGIYLWEHRLKPYSRQVVVTVMN